MTRFTGRAVRVLELLVTDPHSLWQRLKPRVLPARSGRIQINGIYFNIDLELDPCMRHMYFGTYEPEVASVLKRFLKEGDIFIDVGANIGYVSAFALGLVGKTGEVHSFEPVPRYLNRLLVLQKENPDCQLYLNEAALGENAGTALISVTSSKNIGWNTMVPNFMSRDTVEEEVEVEVKTLDSYLSQRNIHRLRLVKIDTEGYEFPVMKGFQKYLGEAEELPVLVIEVAPAAYPKLELSIAEFAGFMERLGYVAYDMNLAHLVDVAKLERTTDVLFLPQSVAERVAPAEV